MRKVSQAPIGIDTSFLVAHTFLEHPLHGEAREQLNQLLDQERVFTLCSTVIDEFIHVVSDPNRFERPFTMAHGDCRNRVLAQ